MPDKFTEVESACQLMCDARHIMLDIRQRPGYRDENGFPFDGMSRLPIGPGPTYDGAEIHIAYDPAVVSQSKLWWIFCHELGHQLQKDDPSMVCTELDIAFKLPPCQRIEIDAWRRAEKMAHYSNWPPTAEFYALAQMTLRTYGVAA
jgi:hypothetical protein